MDKQEEKLLLRVAEAASDYLMGKSYPEFATQYGGIGQLEADLKAAVDAYEGDISERE